VALFADHRRFFPKPFGCEATASVRRDDKEVLEHGDRLIALFDSASQS